MAVADLRRTRTPAAIQAVEAVLPVATADSKV
jgi:hypothetical protein